MVERIKNKRGFTIIEVMVVIALIGILAAVLVPQFGGVRDRAKDAGMLTNAKMVEAYVASVIDSYDNTQETALANAITTQFNTGANALVNPYTSAATGNISVTAIADGAFSAGAAVGVTYVVIDSDDLHVYINGFGSNAAVVRGTQRELTR